MSALPEGPRNRIEIAMKMQKGSEKWGVGRLLAAGVQLCRQQWPRSLCVAGREPLEYGRNADVAQLVEQLIRNAFWAISHHFASFRIIPLNNS